MIWNLFIDDERSPHQVFWMEPHVLSKYHEEDWVIARTFNDALIEVLARGFPSFISFDHDLGDNVKSGYDVAKVLVKCDLTNRDNGFDSIYCFPEDFQFAVHSMNPVGATNITSYINKYMDHVKG